ncbi:MAG: hypothetical protein RIS70_2502 [Planctomycetota bacterium]|jgi:formylglycine-generating enzyme required for sulfatase activity
MIVGVCLCAVASGCGGAASTNPASNEPPSSAPANSGSVSAGSAGDATPSGESLSETTNSIGMKLKLIPAGTFTMGSVKGGASELSHEVTLTKPFYLGAYEVTQEQYERVIGVNPSQFKNPRKPVETVTWDDAVEFCRTLSELPEEKAAGRVYRLPTEAEWEYACRAGTTTEYSFGDSENDLSRHGWFGNNSGKSVLDAAKLLASDEQNYEKLLLKNGCQTHPVGEKQPNAWGLYDMHGNVWEWCSDRFGDYLKTEVIDPVGPETGSNRVRRGGSWRMVAATCRSAFRGKSFPLTRDAILGFRVAMSASKIAEEAEPSAQE